LPAARSIDLDEQLPLLHHIAGLHGDAPDLARRLRADVDAAVRLQRTERGHAFLDVAATQ